MGKFCGIFGDSFALDQGLSQKFPQTFLDLVHVICRYKDQAKLYL